MTDPTQTFSVTRQQIDDLIAQAQLCAADKADDDQKTQDANQKDLAVANAQAALSSASAESTQAKLDELAANAKTKADISKLGDMANALVATPVPALPPDAPVPA